jgi:hypothetical protein
VKTPEEIESYLNYLDSKVQRALGAVSALGQSLATGSTWARINGQVLIPDSVPTAVIQDDAITETKIDDDSVSTPKLQANSITAGKLETNLVLSTKIIGGTYSAPNTFGVELSSAGLKLFDGGGVQRGWLKTDGSGWLGSSTSFFWDTAGVITVAGVTVASSATGARTELSTNGLRVYNSSNQVILELNSTNGFRAYNSTGSTNYNRIAMDGSGWIGSPDGTSANAALSWNGAGTGVLNASKITTGTLNCSSLTVTNFSASSINTGSVTFASGGTMNGATMSGTLGHTGGSLSLGQLTVGGTLTLGSGGKISDADGSFWDQTGIVLVSTGSFGDTIRWRHSSAPSTDVGAIYATSGSIGVYRAAGLGGGGFFVDANAFQVDAGGNSMIFSGSGNYLQVEGVLYPGDTSGGVNGTYYIEGAGSIQSNGIGIGGMLGISSGNTINFVSPGTGGSASNWSSFTVANIPDKSAGYFLIQIAGTSYRVPFYANG